MKLVVLVQILRLRPREHFAYWSVYNLTALVIAHQPCTNEAKFNKHLQVWKKLKLKDCAFLINSTHACSCVLHYFSLNECWPVFKPSLLDLPFVCCRGNYHQDPPQSLSASGWRTVYRMGGGKMDLELSCSEYQENSSTIILPSTSKHLNHQ